ncbi:hypothetical protein [Macrococcus armenti]|uniref:hypothetical protein n=1 Tax=Macrococcus armenti TaxID=2875764 RepID=UPI001CCF9DDE|nr:hypothetical protein [Macrococcus armenti]UBH12836.1 hypothetical protein LAU43_09945 [Macrococcus armenti]
MIKEPIIATTMLFALIALGEIISIYTRARVPMLLTAMLGYLFLSWFGVFPPKILEYSTVPALGAVLIGPLILHMGTIMPLHVLKSQWKAVIISLSGLVGATILILGIVTPIFGFPTAASGLGPVAGGVIALLITNEKLTALGMSALIVVPSLVQALQGVIGMPLASHFMNQYVKKDYIHRLRNAPDDLHALADDTYTHSKISILNNNTIRLFIVFVFAAIGVWLSKVTGIHFTIYCLLFGVLLLNTKVLPQNTLEKANALNFILIATIFVVIGSMGGVKPEDVMKNILPVICILGLGALGIMLGGFVASKLLKWPINKGMPVALTALFGFPGDYILCQEVARSHGQTEEEVESIMNELVTPMLIGGFVTVTISSVIIANVVMDLI